MDWAPSWTLQLLCFEFLMFINIKIWNVSWKFTVWSAPSMRVLQGITHFFADRPMVMAVGGKQRQMDGACVCIHACVSACVHACVFVSTCAFFNMCVYVSHNTDVAGILLLLLLLTPFMKETVVRPGSCYTERRQRRGGVSLFQVEIFLGKSRRTLQHYICDIKKVMMPKRKEQNTIESNRIEENRMPHNLLQ